MKKKILVIDDELELRQGLEARLTSAGYQVILAWNGVEGIEKAVTEKPNLILLDLTMPEMDGLMTLEELRKRDETRNTPVIMLTGKSDTDSIMKFQAMGVIDYFVKPYNSQELVTYIARYI